MEKRRRIDSMILRGSSGRERYSPITMAACGSERSHKGKYGRWPRPLSGPRRRNADCEPGSVEYGRRFRYRGQGWEHVVRHARWLEQMEQRADYGLRQTGRE